MSSTPATKPIAPSPVDVRTIPALAWLTQPVCVRWVAWKYEWVPTKAGAAGKWTKVPKQPTGSNARNNDATTWYRYDDVWPLLGRFDGIGLMLLGLPGVQFAAIDLDKCRDPPTGKLLPWVQHLVNAAAYVEVTPSDEGVRILGKVDQIDSIHRRMDHPEGGGFELYVNCERYITISGRAVNGTASLSDLAPQFATLRALLNQKSPPPPSPGGPAAGAAGGSTAAGAGTAQPIDLTTLSLVVVELITKGTLDGKALKKRGPAFFRVVKALHAKGHDFASVLALLEQHTSGIAGKYKGRLEIELQRAWDKLPAGSGGLELPDGFSLNPQTGLWFQPQSDGDEDDTSEPVWVCGPLTVLATTADDGSQQHGLLLEWVDDRSVGHTWAMPRDLVHSEGNAIAAELESKGLHCGTSKRAHALIKTFLGAVRADRQVKCVTRVGWHGDAYVLSADQGFGADGLVLQGNRATNRGSASRGMLADWQQHVADYAVGNTRLMFAISAAFAGPLLDIVNAPSGGVHFHGNSQIGKTTLQACATSVWGSPGAGGAMRSWRATANGLEGIAQTHCDGLLVLDETGQADPHEVVGVVYMLSNGQGKQRANQFGGAAPSASWRLMFLSSGETTIATKVAEARKRVAAGADVRLLNVAADAKADLGVWEDLHGLASGAALTDHLRRAATTYYGTASSAFLEQLVEMRKRDPARCAERLRQAVERFVEKVLPADASGQVRSAAVRFGLIAVAGELARVFGILLWGKGDATQAAAACFQEWLVQRGGAAAGEHISVLRAVRGFLAAHGTGRFAPAKKPPTDRWGQEPELPRIQNQAGYVAQSGDAVTEFWILPPVWSEELCRGHGLEPATAVAVLREHRFLIGATGRHPADHQRVWGRPKSIRVYRVASTILEEADE